MDKVQELPVRNLTLSTRRGTGLTKPRQCGRPGPKPEVNLL